MEAQFLQYTTLGQYASGLGPVFAFAAWQGSQSALDTFLHLDNDWVFDPQLHTAVTQAGLQRSGRANEQLLAEGLSNSEIAERLVLSEATVKSNLGRVMQKWGVRDRVQVLIFAAREGIVSL